MPLLCRFYEHKFPEVEDVVMVNVRSIAEMGAYVHLLEYNNIEGMILLSELSRRRIRSINKLIRIGRDECVVVIRVDKDKGYIDLSKRRVSAEEVVKCEEKFAKAKAVNSILRHVAALLKYDSDSELEELYMKTAWMFDRKYGKPGASYDAFKHAVTNPEILNECEIDDITKEKLLENIRRRLTPQAVKIRSDIEVACYEYEGVDAVKEALKCGLNMSTEDMPIKINLIAPPLYVITTNTLERADGLTKLTEVLEHIKKVIEANGGVFTIKMAPKVVSDTEEMELARHLERLEEQNREISGDEASESSGAEENGDGEGDDENPKPKTAAAKDVDDDIEMEDDDVQ